MKKIFILAFALCALCSCDNEEFNNSNSEDYSYEYVYTCDISSLNEEEYSLGLSLGWQIYELHTKTPDLHVSEEICDRLEEDNNDLSAVIDCVRYLSCQPIFGDTIAECEVWEQWNIWFYRNFR